MTIQGVNDNTGKDYSVSVNYTIRKGDTLVCRLGTPVINSV